MNRGLSPCKKTCVLQARERNGTADCIWTLPSIFYKVKKRSAIPFTSSPQSDVDHLRGSACKTEFNLNYEGDRPQAEDLSSSLWLKIFTPAKVFLLTSTLKSGYYTLTIMKSMNTNTFAFFSFEAFSFYYFSKNGNAR